MTKLAIEEEREEDMFDFVTTAKCYECGGVEIDRTAGNVKDQFDCVGITKFKAKCIHALAPSCHRLCDGSTIREKTVRSESMARGNRLLYTYAEPSAGRGAET